MLGLQDYHTTESTIFHLLHSRVLQQPLNLYFLCIFVLALIHAFCAPFLLRTALRHLGHTQELDVVLEGSLEKNPKIFSKQTFFWEWVYFVGEIEVVFGLWLIPLTWGVLEFIPQHEWFAYVNGLDYTEGFYLFVSMAIASTYPIVRFVERVLAIGVNLLGGKVVAWWWTILTVAPFCASVFKDSGIMTLSSILLLHQFFPSNPSRSLQLATMSLLFVNINACSALTNFASPTSVLVSKAWGWSTGFMWSHFAHKVLLGILIVNGLTYWRYRHELHALSIGQSIESIRTKIPAWITIVHIFFLGMIIWQSKEPVVFLTCFVLFLGFYQATSAYQTVMSLKGPILIAFFIATLLMHLHLQVWWVEALEETLQGTPLSLMAFALTAFCHNTTVAYLATFLPSLSLEDQLDYFAGAVSAGGLTLISSSANMVGYKILSQGFQEPIDPFNILLYSWIPSVLMWCVFVFL